jgi:hypothetical protein
MTAEKENKSSLIHFFFSTKAYVAISAKQIAVLDAILEYNTRLGHPSVPQIIELLEKENTKPIRKPTVYEIVKILVDKKFLNEDCVDMVYGVNGRPPVRYSVTPLGKLAHEFAASVLNHIENKSENKK